MATLLSYLNLSSHALSHLCFIRAARVLCAGQAWCPAGRCSDGGGIQRFPTCYNRPQQQEEGPVHGTAAGFALGRGQHFMLLMSQAVIGIERFPGSLCPSCVVALCGATTGLQLAPVLPIAPPSFCQTPMHLFASCSPLLRSTVPLHRLSHS